MNPKKGFLISVIVASLVCTNNSLPGVSSAVNLEGIYEISSIHITHTAWVFGLTPFTSYSYKITSKNGYYYSDTGKKIHPFLICNLADSLTDLYESSEYEDSYDGFFMTDYYPHFEVVLSLENGGTIIMKTDSNYHCWIPWNVEYNGKTYVQYNGEIPSALLRILAHIDEKWSYDEKLIKWGCYPAPVPERYAKKGISKDFPASTPVEPVEEILGRTHLMWKADVETAVISPPEYLNKRIAIAAKNKVVVFNVQTGDTMWEKPLGTLTSNLVLTDEKIFVTILDTVTALDFETGKKVWGVRTEEEKRVSSWRPTRELIICEGVLYVGLRGHAVVSIDAESGKIFWKHKTPGTAYPSLQISGDKLLVVGNGLMCLERETGERVWWITDFAPWPKFYQDRILIEARGKDMKWYRALVDIDSGETLWTAKGSDAWYPYYQEGFLYFGVPEEKKIVSLDAETKEEVWSYPFENMLGRLEFFEEGILVVLVDEEKDCLDRLVFLDKTGSKIWEHAYKKEINWSIGARFEVFQDILFFLRGGFIEAVDLQTGKRLWEIEVRGTSIHSLKVCEDKVYVAANDCRFYCLDVITGEVIWFYELEKEVRVSRFFAAHVLVSDIVGSSIFMATREGSIFAFSLTETPVPPVLPRKGSPCAV